MGNNPWHLDKKITLSLIWSIVIVIAGGIFTTSWVMFESPLRVITGAVLSTTLIVRVTVWATLPASSV